MNPAVCAVSAQAYPSQAQPAPPLDSPSVPASAQSYSQQSPASASASRSASNKRVHESSGYSDWEEATTPKRRRTDPDSSSPAQLRSAILDLEALVKRLIAKNVQLKKTRSRVLREGMELTHEVDSLMTQASHQSSLQYIAAHERLTSLREKMNVADRRSWELESQRVQEEERNEDAYERRLKLEGVLRAIARSTHRYL